MIVDRRKTIMAGMFAAVNSNSSLFVQVRVIKVNLTWHIKSMMAGDTSPRRVLWDCEDRNHSNQPGKTPEVLSHKRDGY